jgi:DUF2934 family protein
MRSKIGEAPPTKEQIEARAYELYLRRDRKDGQGLEDWLIAENELKQDLREGASVRTALRGVLEVPRLCGGANESRAATIAGRWKT